MFCFIDDILIEDSNVKLLKKKLEEILNRLNNYNVHINVRKCTLLEKCVEF